MIETKAIIFEIKEGQLKKIKLPELSDDIYVVSVYRPELPKEEFARGIIDPTLFQEEVIPRDSSEIKPVSFEEAKHKEPLKLLDKGNIIGHVDNFPIHDKILDDLKANNFDYNIFGKYLETRNIKSWQRYMYAYRVFVRLGEKTLNIIKKAEQKKKYKQRKPKGAIGFSKTYKRWIPREEFARVKLALHKYGFEPTTENISKETMIKIDNVRSVLSYMLEKNKIYKKKTSNRKVIYRPIY